MYDVLIIGAGPTGCTAANILVKKNLRVLLVERHRLPRYKSCSGYLDPKINQFDTALLSERYIVVCDMYPNRKPQYDLRCNETRSICHGL